MNRNHLSVFQIRKLAVGVFAIAILSAVSCNRSIENDQNLRERTSINDNWSFMRYASPEEADNLIYDIRPEVSEQFEARVADSRPTEAIEVENVQEALKPWIMPTANPFIKNEAARHIRPEGNPGSNFPYVQKDFDDNNWNKVDLPHDWGIEGPFLEGWDAEVGGGMGRLASHGVAWYRRKLDIPESDAGKSVFLDMDGAMSYAMVWLNGNLVGGWPYGYNSWRLDLTPYIIPGDINQLAIRMDNPPHSARWYPGGGLYRNVWLVKTNKVHVGHWGTYVTTHDVSKSSATIDLAVTIDNHSASDQYVEVSTKIYELDEHLKPGARAVVTFPAIRKNITAGEFSIAEGSVKLKNPKLWGPPPTQKPHLYMAITEVFADGLPVDRYETRFGVRTVDFDPDRGVFVNGEHIVIQGVNQHHDLGALGAAFNTRAAERQLEILRELGCNAVRMAHNPPTPELLELTDRMGFLVVNEIFDSWERRKTPLDFHLIFPDWYEPDTRAFVRRDRNCPSIILWSFGNEVGEQYTGEEGAAIGRKLAQIVKEEDPTRPTTAAMNWAKPDMAFPAIMDVINLNYQGEGIRDAEAYSHLRGIRTSPMYPAFKEKFPDKVIISSETASALSTRGTYLFPVYEGYSAPAEDGKGGDPETGYVSAYELYTAQFGASPDKVFASLDRHPYVAGEFVWTGWDYIGEPTPYYLSRSSYSGIIDLAGFKKDRFYLYQSRWRPELPMAHILPHWNWPDRVGMVTPVHIFTSGDEAELFLNGQSLGKKKKGQYEYRLRWDDVIYTPGELKVVVYRKGEQWTENTVKTTGEPAKLEASADRAIIDADGKDLSFITIRVTDGNGLAVPDANNLVSFSIEGPGEIVATDNGDPSDLVFFGSQERAAFSGLALAIVRTINGQKGNIRVMAKSEGLESTVVEIESR
jgi:beta-galactosidase